MLQDDLACLAHLGLGGKRGRVYLAIMELGEAPVHAVAEKAGIGRTTAYDVVNGLVQEGLVTQIEKSGKAHVVGEPPEMLLQKLEERQQALRQILPELQAIYNASAAKPKIRYYEGGEGIKTVLNNTLNCRSGKLCGILSMVELLKVPGADFMGRYIRKRVEAGLDLKVVRSPDEEVLDTWLTSASELREVRYAPTGTVFTMTNYVYDDKVTLISSRRENFAMVIQSNEFARLQESLFETLWGASSESGARS